MLTESQKEKIEKLFSDRLAMKPISSFLPLQEPAEECQIMELHKLSFDKYFFSSLNNNENKKFPQPNGRFIFVIPSFSPGKVYCGVPNGYRTFASEFIKPIQGHTSICKKQNVYFAGEILFKNGELLEWSNNSGHYMPEAKLVFSNLIPAVKLMLPMSKFREIF
ncbi:hypothetical protein V5K00_RS23205 [Enterobacter asburiae]